MMMAILSGDEAITIPMGKAQPAFADCPPDLLKPDGRSYDTPPDQARIGAQALLSVESQITLDGKPASRRRRCDRHCRSLSYHLTSLYEIITLVH